jgi:hypothetical protein
MKKRFKVLLLPQEYSFTTQTQLIAALAALHNFIIIHDSRDIYEEEVEFEMSTDDSRGEHQGAVPREEQIRAAERRDHMAMTMWEEYVARPRRCR